MSRKGTYLSVEVIEGGAAPRYPHTTKELIPQKAAITEQGTIDGWPVVDFVLTDKDGNEYFFALTGGIINSVSSIIKGVNLKNHNAEEQP